VKYTPAGGRIAVSARASGDCAELVVEDTGVGIAPEMLPRIFEPFTQAATTIDRSRGGMGLGLALARGLVELHHGTISAGSEGLGRGSRFAFRVPLAAPRTAAAGAPAPPGPARSPRGTRRRVLVVEDNQDNRETLEEVLHVLGHEVASASDGLEGLSRALAQRPEVMVVDIGLPGIDGYELARRVRAALGQAVRLVALTGYGRPEERRRAADAGFDVHLTKPVDPPTLASAITGDAAAAAVVAG
jgi:CheY-like chemotaxis protein